MVRGRERRDWWIVGLAPVLPLALAVSLIIALVTRPGGPAGRPVSLGAGGGVHALRLVDCVTDGSSPTDGSSDPPTDDPCPPVGGPDDPSNPDPGNPNYPGAQPPANPADGDSSTAAPGDYNSDDDPGVGWADPALQDPPQPPPPGPCAYNGDLTAMVSVNEGVEPHVYTDTQGHPSVGIGFNLDRPDARTALASVGANYDQIRAGQADLTAPQMQQLLQNDLAAAQARARHFVPNFDQLSQARQDVLVDMALNLGNHIGDFHNMIGAIGINDFATAADEMLDSRWADQTGDRADRDADIMSNCP